MTSKERIAILNKIIAAVRGDITPALNSDVDIIFCLNLNIMNVSDIINRAHRSGKQIFLHFDLAEGIGKDEAGLNYIKGLGADGIISTRLNIIKSAKKCGLCTVQRFFAVDSQSVNTTIETIKLSKPDMIEIMPGIVTKVIDKIKAVTDIPVIAGGLIETEAEVNAALKSKANAVSTACTKLWKIK